MSTNKKMVSTILTSIHSAFRQLDLLEQLKGVDSSRERRSLKRARYWLRTVKLFVLSARKLGNDANLMSFLIKVREAVGKLAKHANSIRRHCLGYEDPIDDVQEGLDSILEEFGEWYGTLLNTPAQSTLLRKDEILEIMDSFLENLVEFPKVEAKSSVPTTLLDAMNTLGEQMSFLKSLILFVTQTQGNNELEEHLSSHVRDVAICAGYLLTFASYNCDNENLEELLSGIETLVDSIKPIHPESCEAYIDALNSLKQAGRLLDAPTDQGTDDKALTSTKNFIDSLILCHGTCCHPIISVLEDTELDLSMLHDLLEAITNVLAKLGHKDLQVSMFSQLGFFDFLLGKMMEHMNSNAEQSAKSQAQSIREELVPVAYKVEDLIDYTIVGDLPDSLSASFDTIMEDISNIESEIKVINGPEIKVKKVAETHSRMKSTTPSMSKEIVGFHKEANSITNRLIRGSKKLQIVTIVGMPGVGKTTLAEKVYNDPSVSYNFCACAFTTVSQTFDKMRVLIDLLKQVSPDKHSKITPEMTVDDVSHQLRQILKRRSYLILLDDIWEGEVWQRLLQCFPDDSVGSRILLTSHCHDVAHEPHELKELNKDDSLELLQRQLFGENGWPVELGDLGMKIADVCCGLPLTIVIVAGKAKDEHLFQFLEGGYNELSEFNEPRYARRLCIHSRVEHFIKSKLYCSRIRSLLFNNTKNEIVKQDISFIMETSRLLRVLDLEKICLSHGIPSEIGLLVHLAYLAIGGNISEIPPSIEIKAFLRKGRFFCCFACGKF
ncbi:OLC1v1016042C1 [Oldenlandia corymbosa var. corymbosa]|uniref:OLC1v1016042C1 n=1 Tax=Oldenlandia corymbosa var. corymbosa TaxID=529605 RepID=A0AAV1E6G7_OLDCO|nr:OLC1v1016042C1 [Oldenlandia corymbosa var. corymbosa]